MLLIVSHSAARATDQSTDRAPVLGKVNLTELHEVRRDHLPCCVVKLTPLPELERRAAELTRELPHYSEEAAFVVHNERYRRTRLATSPLRIAP
jgi:hypothetical protein